MKWKPCFCKLLIILQKHVYNSFNSRKNNNDLHNKTHNDHHVYLSIIEREWENRIYIYRVSYRKKRKLCLCKFDIAMFVPTVKSFRWTRRTSTHLSETSIARGNRISNYEENQNRLLLFDVWRNNFVLVSILFWVTLMILKIWIMTWCHGCQLIRTMIVQSWWNQIW